MHMMDKFLKEQNDSLEAQLINVLKNNLQLKEENRMLREFIEKIGAKIEETTHKQIDFSDPDWKTNPLARKYKTFQRYEIDRFQFILEDPSETIIDTWKTLMVNGVLDTYDREANKVFNKLDLSKLNDGDYFYIASEISRLIHDKRM